MDEISVADPVRVLQVVPGISPTFGGPSVAIVGLARALIRRSIEANLITTNSDPDGPLRVPLGRPINQDGVQVTYFNVWPRGRYSFSWPLAKAVRQAVGNYDVVHIHWLYNFSSLAAAVSARRAGVPYVLQLNGSLDPHLMKNNAGIKRAYISLVIGIIRHASALIFTSAAERKQALLPRADVPTYVVPVGLDTADYERLPERGEFKKQFPETVNRRIVLFLGRVSRQKGLDLLIPAFKTVAANRPDVHLVIAGPDSEGYEMLVRRWIAEAGLLNRVTVTGRLSSDLKQAAYVDCDVFVLPSHAENFGATVTEALACRKPVVISDHVNICQEIADAEAGIVVRCSPDAVAEGLCRLLDDSKLAVRLAENGRALVQQRFTWDAALDALIPVYRTVIGSFDRGTTT